MWVVSNVGFFSVVQKPEDRGQGLVTIRSRVRADLEALRTAYLPEIGEIIVYPNADYRYRARVEQSVFAVALGKIALDIDYDNFKNNIAKKQGYSRASVYGKLWSVLYTLQEREQELG